MQKESNTSSYFNNQVNVVRIYSLLVKLVLAQKPKSSINDNRGLLGKNLL